MECDKCGQEYEAKDEAEEYRLEIIDDKLVLDGKDIARVSAFPDRKHLLAVFEEVKPKIIHRGCNTYIEFVRK